jgi:ribonuclease III
MTFDSGHVFKDKALLRRALTHTSAARKPLDSNERLEFLGDRVLNMLVAELLENTFPHEREGDLAKRHTNLVCAPTLAVIAEEIGLPDHVILSSSEAASGGAQKTNVIADALEALIAALYVDGGLECARQFVHAHWIPHLQSDAGPPQDSKSKLQEWAQGLGLPLPAYETVERQGPDHAPLFTITVTVKDRGKASGTGISKRDAEKAAAEAMLSSLASPTKAKE